MTQAQKVRKSLSRKIQMLPDYKLQVVLDFVNFLIINERTDSALKKSRTGDFDPADAIFDKYIGGISYGKLAHEIDKELYGA